MRGGYAIDQTAAGQRRKEGVALAPRLLFAIMGGWGGGGLVVMELQVVLRGERGDEGGIGRRIRAPAMVEMGDRKL